MRFLGLHRLKQIEITAVGGAKFFASRERMYSEHVSLSQDARRIFEAAVSAVSPGPMVNAVLKKDSRQLIVADKCFPFESQRIFLVGFGKAVLGMAHTVANILGSDLRSGILSVPFGTKKSFEKFGESNLLTKESSIQIYEGAENNIPDEAAMSTAKNILTFVERLKKNDLLLVLISGGGSALLPLPISPITLEEKVFLIKLLARHGANIQELNTVRKTISAIKGGKLALAAGPAQVISLILSDVIGDPLDQIASGPTVPCDNKLSRALEIIDKYAIRDQLPQSILKILENDDDCCLTSGKEERFDRVYNYLIGNNLKALQAAESLARELDYATSILSTEIQGEAKSFGELLGRIANYVMAASQTTSISQVFYDELQILLPTYGIPVGKCDELQKIAKTCKHIAILSGGETVVRVTGQGKGGRNQEISLAFGIYLNNFTESHWDFTLLAAGTDGQDGPTDAAGAVSYLGQFHNTSSDCDPCRYLQNNDSNTFYQKFKASDLVVTGITNTNVMDVHILLLSYKPK